MNTKTLFPATAALGLSLVASLGLAGCASTPSVPAGATYSADAATPSPTATSAGRQYTMQDGTKVTLDPSAPIPEAVIADTVAAHAAAIATATSGDFTESGKAWDDIQKELGRTVIMVWQGLTSTPNPDDGMVVMWTASMPASCEPDYDKAVVIQCAQDWMSAHPNSATLVVVP